MNATENRTEPQTCPIHSPRSNGPENTPGTDEAKAKRIAAFVDGHNPAAAFVMRREDGLFVVDIRTVWTRPGTDVWGYEYIYVSSFTEARAILGY